MSSARNSFVWTPKMNGDLDSLEKQYKGQLEGLVNCLGAEFTSVEDMLTPTQKQMRNFSDHGFDDYTLYYRKPEKYWNEVGLLVPKGLDLKRSAPVHVFFLGGGFWTGDWTFCPWYQQASLRQANKQGAIILSVNYPRFPLADIRDITRAVDDFWDYFYSDDMIKDCKAQVNDLIIDRKKLIISGESAGGYVAAYSVIRPHKKLEVKALFLRYPMLRYYERVDRNELKLKYMGKNIDKENVEENATALWTFVHQTMRPAMKAAGLLGLSDEGIYADILDRRSPPYGMCGALTSSWLGTWSDYFGMTTKGERLDDILTQLLRANRRDEDVGPHNAPALFIYHGTKDINVPLEVSETFVEEWKRMFKSHDLNGKVHLKTVDAGHGFDYTLHDDDNLDNETTIGGFMDDLATFWKFG